MGLLCVSYSFDSILIRFFFSFIYFVAGSDWPLYIGLAVVGAICVALGAGLARGARKGRRLPPYSIARTGKRCSLHFNRHIIWMPVSFVCIESTFCTLCTYTRAHGSNMLAVWVNNNETNGEKKQLKMLYDRAHNQIQSRSALKHALIVFRYRGKFETISTNPWAKATTQPNGAHQPFFR